MELGSQDIEKLNKFLKNHIFTVNHYEHLRNDDKNPLRVRVKITGINEYISIGDKKPFLEYTLYILPTESNIYNLIYGVFAKNFGKVLNINTKGNEYDVLRYIVSKELTNFLNFFGVDMPVICKKVVNEIPPAIDEIKESKMKKLVKEDKYDSVVRTIVRDIISIYKLRKAGEFGLPEDLRDGEVFYEFDQLENSFQVFLEIIHDNSVDGFDVDADLYRDEELIYVTLILNPQYDERITYDLIGELNELIRHEIEHLKQYESGYRFPKDPKKPEKYYSQKHEVEAQRAGFKRAAKVGKFDYETLVRRWFDDNKHKHNLNPEEAERVIQKILKEK